MDGGGVLTRPASPLWAGLRQRCPHCGEAPVFSAYLRLRASCGACGADFRTADAGDGPAVFVILVVGALAAPLVVLLQFVLHWPAWSALGVPMMMAVGLSLALLPIFKATLFALQWAHKARQALNADLEDR